MGIRLFLEESDGSRRNLNLDDPVVVIGRGADNEVVVKDQRSSRKHCRVSETPHGVVLEDLQSANGTILNGKPVSRCFLKPGDEFRVGNARLIYQPDGEGSSREEDHGSADADAGARASAASAASAATTAVKGPAAKARPAGSRRKRTETAGTDSLTCVAGPLKGETFPIGDEPFLLGRKSDCDARLADKRISSQHARIVRRGEELVVEDLESKNGILVDGRKVKKARLVTGSRLVLGSFVFEAKVRGTKPRSKKKRRGGPEAEVQGPPGTESVEELALGRVDVDRFFASHRFEQPLITGALVLVIGLLSYFAIDIARRVLIEQEVDPRSPENRIARNWSFEELPGEGTDPRATVDAIPGWRLGEGDRGELRVTRELAQYPGLRALELVATGDQHLCSAVHAEAIAVVRGMPYTLRGFVGNRGAFFAGFLVEWLESFGDEARVVARSFSECVQIPDGTLDVEETFRAPAGATHARVSCVIYAAGASAVFDRVSFAASAEEDEVVAHRETETVEDVRFTLAGRTGGSKDGGGFTLSMLPEGLFSLSDDSGEAYPAFWASVASDRDHLAIGPRLARPLVRSGDRGSIHVTTYVPDLAETRWVTLESTVRSSGAEASFDWQVTVPSDAPRAVALYWLSRRPSLQVLIHGSSSRKVRFSDAMDKACEEIVFGEKKRRISFSFPASVVLESRRRPGVDGAWLLIARPRETGTLRVGVAAGSRREKEAALAMLEEAERLYQTGAIAEAWERLGELPKLYPEQTHEVALARQRLAAWRQAAERELAGYRAAIADYRENPMPAIYRSLLARGRSWAERLQGTPEGSRFEGAVRDLVRHRESLEERRREAEHSKLLAEAKDHFQKRRYGLCELNARLLLEADAAEETAQEARSLIDRIASRRETVKAEILFR